MEASKAVQDFLKEWEEEKEKSIKIAFFGQPGAGKSSLINELVGRKVSETSNLTDTTKKAQVIDHNGVIYVDLPGYDTSKFPENKFFSTFDPLQYDLFICVFSGKLHKADSKFFKLLKEENRICLFVRNKADSIYDEVKTQEEAKLEIIDDVKKQVGDGVEVLFTSCRKNIPLLKRGIIELQEKILTNIEPAEKDKFIRSASAYTKEFLIKKKKSSQWHLKKAMIQAAANGLNPIFGVDIGIDATIMSAMYANIRETFDITPKELDNPKFKGPMVELINMGLKKENIIKGIKMALSDELTKKMGKYIPLVGQVLAMSVSAGSMYFLGLEYLDACYAFAKQKMEIELNQNEN